MKRHQHRTLLVCLAFFAASASLSAADGVLMVQKITSGTTVSSSQSQMEATRMRTEVTDPSGRTQVVVFDATRDVLLVIDAAKKSYTEMTRADAERLGGMMSGAMARMKEQLAGLPPEQRAMMEKQMGPMMAGLNGGAVVRPEYRRNGTGQVGKWTCDKYDGFTAGQKTSEICTVDPRVLGLNVADFAVTAKMVAFVASMLPQMANQLVGIGTPELGFTGVPVRTAGTVGGNQVTMELTEVRRDTFADALFQAPPGFQKTPLGIGR
jgi:hypothetical protein